MNPAEYVKSLSDGEFMMLWAETTPDTAKEVRVFIQGELIRRKLHYQVN